MTETNLEKENYNTNISNTKESSDMIQISQLSTLVKVEPYVKLRKRLKMESDNLDRCKAFVMKRLYMRDRGFALSETKIKPRCVRAMKKLLEQEQVKLDLLRVKLGLPTSFVYRKTMRNVSNKRPLKLQTSEVIEIDSDTESKTETNNPHETNLEVSLMNEIIVSVNREVEKMVKNSPRLDALAIKGLVLIKQGMEILKRWCQTTGNCKKPNKRKNQTKKCTFPIETVIIKEELDASN